MEWAGNPPIIYQQSTIKDHKILHNHIYTWMKADDALLAVAREAEAHRAGNRRHEWQRTWESSGSATGTFQKFQNSLKNTYFSLLYILIYNTSWCFRYYLLKWYCAMMLLVLFHSDTPEQLYHHDKVAVLDCADFLLRYNHQQLNYC